MPAKKAAIEKPPFIPSDKPSPGAGYKKCPACHGYVRGPKTATCPGCNAVFTPKTARAAKEKPDAGVSIGNALVGINRDAVLKVLAGKGFKISRLVDTITGEIHEEKIDPKIEALGLQFKAVGQHIDAIHVTQTTPQIQVTLTLEKLLDLARIKP